EDVTEREEAEAGPVGLELRDELRGAERVRHQVAVREHDTLGIAGGARGVDDRGEVRGRDARRALANGVLVLREGFSSAGPKLVEADRAGHRLPRAPRAPVLQAGPVPRR